MGVCRAVAVHPGYGFLSENAAFVDACEQAGIAFLGPCAATMRMFSRKHTAREFAEKAGCPVLSGSSLLSSVEEAAACAEKVRGWCSESAERLQDGMQPPVCQPCTSEAGSWRSLSWKMRQIACSGRAGSEQVGSGCPSLAVQSRAPLCAGRLPSTAEGDRWRRGNRDLYLPQS